MNEIFSCLDLIEDVLKVIDDSKETNERRHEIIYPRIVEFFVSNLKKEVKANKIKYEGEINQLQHEKNVLQGVIDKTKEMLDKTRDNYEKQIRDLKDENLDMRLDVNIFICNKKLEAKIDEKMKMIKNLQK